MMNDYLGVVETNEAQDVAGSVRHAIKCWEFTNNDQHAWKWVILALHGALQGACVCHLVTTARPVGAVTNDNRIEWIDYFEKSRSDRALKKPKTKLMALPDLLKAVRKPNSVGQYCGINHQVTISDHELQWLVRIHNEFRNQFVHFNPTGWVFEVSGMPKLAQLIARIIKDIMTCHWAFKNLNEKQRNELKENLKVLASMT